MAQPGYVQGNSAVPQTSQTTVTLPYTSAQTAGDLNVVVVGWNDTTAKVSSVTDTSGNTYTLAVGPTLLTGAVIAIHLLCQKYQGGGRWCERGDGEVHLGSDLPGHSDSGVQRP